MAAGFALPDQVILNILSELSWGPSGPAKLLAHYVAEIQRLAPWLPADVIRAFLSDIEPYADLAGLFGNPEEIEKSGMDELLRVDDRDLERGRAFFRLVVSLFDFGRRLCTLAPATFPPAIATATEAIVWTLSNSDEWATTVLAVGSIAAYRHRLHAEETRRVSN